MSSKTDDLDRAVRIAAERFKSFPRAVAAVVREMYDRGADGVLLSFERDLDGELTLKIMADRDVFPWVEVKTSIGETDPDRFVALMAVGFHHGVSATITADSYKLHGLGTGHGVNPRQNRTPERLVRTLPALLSPHEAYRTVVVDEHGKEHELFKALPQSAKANGFEVDIPEKFIWVGDNRLVVKFGAVRVPIATLLSRAKLDQPQLARLSILTHPWLRGVMEVRVRDETLGVPVPTKSAEDFDHEDFGDWDMATTLANALLYTNVPYVVASRIGKVIDSALSEFDAHQELSLEGHTYLVHCADPSRMDDASDTRPVIYENEDAPEGVTELLVDATHPVFRTVHPMDEEVMQVVWWQLAHWIAMHQPDICPGEHGQIARVTRIYLELREQNPERGYDAE